MLKSFILVGQDESQATEVEVDITHDLEALKLQIAATFTIAEPAGIGFQTPNDGEIVELPVLLEAQEPIGIIIDGHIVREPPGPKGLPFVGSYYEVFPDHLGNHQRLFETYGPIFKTIDLGKTTYHTNDPAIAAVCFAEIGLFDKTINADHPLAGIKNDDAGLFISDSGTPQWKLAHKFMPPALSPKAVRHYTPVMQKTVEESFQVFDELDDRGESWNCFPYMMKLGSATIGKLSFGIDFHHFDKVDSPMHRVVTAIAESLTLNKRVTSKGAWYAHLPFGDPARLKVVQKEIHDLIGEAIAKTAAGGVEDLPMETAALNASSIVDYAIRAADTNGNKFPQEQLIATMITVTGAGFVTTASLLSWLLYGMVTYDGMQSRLLQELIDAGIDDKTQWTFDLTNSLPFLDKYIKETQRLHNPSYQPGRTAKMDVIVPGGYRIPTDAVVIVALHHIHNNPAIWDNPHKFDPDRWDDLVSQVNEEIKRKTAGAEEGESADELIGIGFNLALQEVKVILPELIYRYEFVKASEDPTTYNPEYQLIRPENLYVRARKRTSWPMQTPKPAEI